MNTEEVKPNLPYSSVDPHSPVPLYHQIYLDLRRMVQRDILFPGDMLPPELDICQAYGVGRQTVRQAISRLVDEQMVERFAGRGTFIREQPNFIQFFLDRSFSQQMREMGLKPHSQVLSHQTGNVELEVPPMQGYRGEPCLMLERLRLGDNEPICHQISTILSKRCPGIEQQDFNQQSLYEVLATQYQLMINRIDHVVRATAADGYRADLLHVEEGTPLLFVGTTTYLEDDEVIEYSSSYYRADRYEYSTSQTCRST
ncbi:MAG: GntR family transcriptional regulator [Anaerolineales bacterium]|nr:GntR family transcriptional regulator [Anaerolineales bacterium]